MVVIPCKNRKCEMWEPEAYLSCLKHTKTDTCTTYLPEDKPLTNTQALIAKVCDEIKELLLEKNRKYGDSAINPKRVFSKASAIEQINVRLDDKISRLISGQEDDTEDVELDLVGYLVLKRVAKEVQDGQPG